MERVLGESVVVNGVEGEVVSCRQDGEWVKRIGRAVKQGQCKRVEIVGV
jgi:hypothetical protein